MKYKYQVSVFSYYYPTVALFEHEGEALDYFDKKTKEYSHDCLVTFCELQKTSGEVEDTSIEWY